MRLIVQQSDKPHDANQLHDAFIAANLAPLSVESTDVETRFEFGEGVTEQQAQAVVSGYVKRARQPPPDLKALWTTYRTNLQAATTVAQIKTVLTNDLGPILRAIAVGHRGDMNGG